MKSALITGITGQDGSYLAELLLSKDYKVSGLLRRKSQLSYGNVEHLKDKITFIYGDVQDTSSLLNAISISKPDEIYNLAAQSFVGTSWEQPLLTVDVDGIGVLNVLEAVRISGCGAKVYQASTSEMFGLVQEVPQTETTPLHPRSPYGVAKLYGYWIMRNYRESYGMFTCNGILFNHESERRGEEFVTRKITMAVARIKSGIQDKVELGNLDSKRDWGHAEDYVYAMWLMMQQEKPEDYVISTEETRTVREFLEVAFSEVGISIRWEGKDVNEKGYDAETGKQLVGINPKYYRPAEVELLLGDCSKARTELGWNRKIEFPELVRRMVRHDMSLISGESS